MPSPTALTLTALRRSGFQADVCERWVPIPGKNIRRDLFGIGDIIAIDRREGGFLLVQATSLTHVGDRLRKARTKPALRDWLKAGGRFEVWGWAKRAGRWAVQRVAVNAGGLADVLVEVPARRKRQPKQPSLFGEMR